MSTKLPLNEMTVQEKLAAMESLWEDLSRSPEAIESPAWHKDILDQRQQRNCRWHCPIRGLGEGKGQNSRESSVKIEILDEAERT